MSKLDVLLISPPASFPAVHIEANEGVPPLGLCYLATYLVVHEGYSARIIDMALRSVTIETVLSTLRHRKPRVVGFSCATETYQTTVRLAKIVKEAYPNCIVVLGGYHTSFEYKAALKEDIIDYVVLSEGEISFTNLCNFIIRKVGIKESIKGIAYNENGTVIKTEAEPFINDLDRLPIPDRNLIDNIHEYSHPATISTSRGCPGKCIFCAASVLSGGRYRMRSAQSIVAEFEYLKSLGFDYALILDDTMTVNRERLNVFLDELISRDLQMTWFCESRVDALTNSILLKMKNAGLTSIQFGVESGSQVILDSVNKGITLERVRKVFTWCKELEIQATTNLIIGQHSDTKETIKDTMHMVRELTSLGAFVTLSISTPFPGTPIWKTPEKFGMQLIDFDLDNYNMFCPVFSSQYLTATEIRNEYYSAWSELQKLQRNHPLNNSRKSSHREASSVWFE